MTENPHNPTPRLRHWIAEVFGLPEATVVSVTERQSTEAQRAYLNTDIVIRFGREHFHTFVIAKPLSDISYHDVKQLRAALRPGPIRKHPVFSHIFRLIGWFFGFSGLYMMFAVCPFCGQPGCPVGAGSAGLMGGFFAVLMQYSTAVAKFVNNKLLKRNKNTRN